MNMPLPDAVTTYFEISNGGDPSRVAECFVQDATVIDEEKMHRGIDAIETWQRQIRAASAFKVMPMEAVRSGDRLTVTTRVVGDFTGSPLDLSHSFVLGTDRIRLLEIRS